MDTTLPFSDTEIHTFDFQAISYYYQFEKFQFIHCV